MPTSTAYGRQTMRTTAAWRYGMPAIVLHWVLAVLIAAMAGLGWYMMTVEKQPQGPWYFDLHRSIGLVVAVLVLARLAWRLTHGPAPLPASLRRWQVRLASATHWLLYLCMIVMPVTGIIGAGYSRSGLAFFGFALPAWSAPDRQLSHLFFNIHSVAVWILVALVVVHAAAGLKHLLVDQDAVFQRMWF